MNLEAVQAIAQRAVRSYVVPLLLASPAGHASAQTATSDGRSLPLTIQVTQDVPVKISERRPDGSGGQERGTLYSNTSFRISKAQQFEMTEILGEGGCRIDFQGSNFELSSCPWLPGFRDHQADVFRVMDKSTEAP